MDHFVTTLLSVDAKKCYNLHVWLLLNIEDVQTKKFNCIVEIGDLEEAFWAD